MEKVRVGIIGAGQNTRKTHIPNLQAIPGVEILQVANRTMDSGKKAAAQFGIPKVAARWQDVATSKDIDAVVIGTWPYLHCEASCLALESGKHVLCEARMAMNLAEAETMYKVSRKHPGLVAQLVPSPFTLRVDKTVADYLRQGKLGKPSYFHFDHQSRPLAPPGQKNLLHWRKNKKYSGVNTMVLGIAYESILRWLGPAEWVNAMGHVFNDTAINPETGREEKIEIPDYLAVQMKLKNEMLGTFLISETALNAEPPFLEIFGDQGTLHYPFAVAGDLYFQSRADKEKKVVAISPRDEGRWRVEEEFINAVRGKEQVKYTTFETGVEYMKFTEAVIDSFKNNGERINL